MTAGRPLKGENPNAHAWERLQPRNSPYPTGQNPLAAKERKERRENSKTQYLMISQRFFALFCGYSQ